MPRLLPPWRTLLPPEHGTWFMLGFPLVLGLLVRPSLAGFLLGMAALAAFFARPPLRRVLSGQRDPAQRRALLLFTALAVAAGGGTFLLAGPRFLAPLGLAAPLIFWALRADLNRTVRTLPVELAAQGAFAALAAAILLAGGSAWTPAGILWLMAALVGGANLAHVRRLLGIAHDLDAAALRRRWLPVHVLHVLLVGSSVLLLARRGPMGVAWTTWSVLLYLRALLPGPPNSARVLGWREGALSAAGLLILWRASL
jgi:hypothetical protein